MKLFKRKRQTNPPPTRGFPKKTPETSILKCTNQENVSEINTNFKLFTY